MSDRCFLWSLADWCLIATVTWGCTSVHANVVTVTTVVVVIVITVIVHTVVTVVVVTVNIVVATNTVVGKVVACVFVAGDDSGLVNSTGVASLKSL